MDDYLANQLTAKVYKTTYLKYISATLIRSFRGVLLSFNVRVPSSAGSSKYCSVSVGNSSMLSFRLNIPERDTKFVAFSNFAIADLMLI